MSLFSKPDPNAQARQAEQNASIYNLEHGGLPTLAMRRIQEDLANPRKMFTSDLSVNEFLLTRKTGYAPVAQVIGSSIYHVGWQYAPIYSSGELTLLTHAYWHARMLALSRMQQEARLLKAHGVVGVRVDRHIYDWGQNLIEFAVMGTAIKLPDEAPPEHPFLSDLSGQEFWALRQAGFFPVGFAFGNCVWYEVASWATQMANNQGGWGTGWYNQELTDFTQAMYQTRHLAMQRLQDESRRMGASGVVGADIETEVSPYERDLGNDQTRTDLLVNFHAFGTAVVEAEPDQVPQVDYGLPLTD